MMALYAQTKKAVEITVAYADEVRTLSSVTNQSEEDTSRLIQVMDDYGLSAQQAGMAARFLSKEGLSMNIETLAQLSDQYKGLNSGQERAAFLMKNFGKAGQDFTLMMEQGSQAILDRNGAVEKNLIMSKKQLKAAQDYKYALDNLEDAWRGVNVQLGNAAIPKTTEALVMLMNRLNGNITTMDVFKWTQQQWLDGLIDAVPVLKTIADLLDTTYDKGGEYSKTLDRMSDAQENYYRSQAKLIPVIEDNSAAIDERLGLLSTMASEEMGYEERLMTLEEERATLTEDRNKLIADGYKNNKDAIGEIDAALQENSAQIQANADAHRAATNQIVYDLLYTRLNADGEISDKEAAFLEQMGIEWGLWSDTVVDEVDVAQNRLDVLLNGYNGRSINIGVNFALPGEIPIPDQGIPDDGQYFAPGESGWGEGSDNGTMQAKGGPIGKGWTMVGEQGFELIDPTGYVHSNPESKKLIRMGVTPFKKMAQGGDDFPTDIQSAQNSIGQMQWINAMNSFGMSTQGVGGVANPGFNGPSGGGGGGGGSSAVLQMAVVSTRQAAASARDSSQLVSAMEKMLRQKNTVSAPVVSLSADTIRQMASAFAGEVKRGMG